jgi:hypothetical protein
MSGAEDLEWVTQQQEVQLEQSRSVRGEWRDWLPGQLDTFWPEWRSSDAPTLAPWLDSLLPSLGSAEAVESEAVESESESEAEAVEAAAVDVSDLSWVTAEQSTQLDQLHEIRGDWHEWLPVELDRIGEWRYSSPGALAQWLESIIPTFVMPAEAVTESDAEALTATLTEALQGDAEMAAIVANLSPEELAALLDEALASHD